MPYNCIKQIRVGRYCYIYFWNVWYFFQDSLINKKIELLLFKIDFCFHSIKSISLLYSSLLNKSINFFKKKKKKNHNSEPVVYIQKISVLNNLFKESWKKYYSLQKILSSTTVSNTDNKWAYYYEFWRSCDTVFQSNDAENTASHHRN